MGVNGKQKGNDQERHLSNMLSARFEAYSGIKQSFRRNPDSGSFWGASNQKRTETHDTEYANFGDLLCPKNFNYSIESKAYKKAPSLESIMTQKVTEWDLWLKQCEQDAKNANKKPALIVKYNGVKEIVFLTDGLREDGDPAYDGEIIPPVIHYKQYFVYQLKTFLEQPDSLFFNK